MHIELRLPLCNSLKEKRNAIRPCIHFARKQWNLSVSEVGAQNARRSAILALSAVSNDKSLVENMFREALRYFESQNGLEVVDAYVEIL